MQSLGRHWKKIADEVEFSSPRTTLELKMRYDCLEDQERNELAMLLEREYIHVDQPLDGVLEVGFPAETGEDAELARVRVPELESSDDDDEDGDAPGFAPAEPGFLEFSSSRVAELRAAGDQRPLPQMVRAIRQDWFSLEPEDRNEWAVPRQEASPRERRGKTSFGARGRRRPSVVGQA
jgi:hypothetical protein